MRPALDRLRNRVYRLRDNNPKNRAILTTVINLINQYREDERQHEGGETTRTTSHAPDALHRFLDHIVEHCSIDEVEGGWVCDKCGYPVAIDWFELDIECQGCDEVDFDPDN